MASDNSEPCVTVRRNLEQAKHCIEEALSVVEHGEATSDAIADLEQGKELILVCLRRLRNDPR